MSNSTLSSSPSSPDWSSPLPSPPSRGSCRASSLSSLPLSGPVNRSPPELSRRRLNRLSPSSTSLERSSLLRRALEAPRRRCTCHRGGAPPSSVARLYIGCARAPRPHQPLPCSLWTTLATAPDRSLHRSAQIPARITLGLRGQSFSPAIPGLIQALLWMSHSPATPLVPSPSLLSHQSLTNVHGRRLLPPPVAASPAIPRRSFRSPWMRCSVPKSPVPAPSPETAGADQASRRPSLLAPPLFSDGR